MGHTEDKDRVAAVDAVAFRILAEKKAGEDTTACEIRAGSPMEKVYGVAVLVRELAKATGRSLESTICLLASVLLTPEGERHG